MTRIFPLLLGAFCLVAGLNPLLAGDPLPSWVDTPLKASLVDFVTRVTTAGTSDFVPPPERIAVFDNDGTLCAEQPMYFQFAFGVDCVEAQAAVHPEWKEKQPFKAALQNDVAALGATEVQGLNELVAGTHIGWTTEALRQGIATWWVSAKHPTLHRPYAELVYLPMTELLQYLRAHGFKTYVVTGSAADFLRPMAEKAYGIPAEQIIGSNLETVLKTQEKVINVEVTGGVSFINNKSGKALAIDRIIGRRPILAFGNSDGDLDMLRLTAGGSRPHWTGLVHHTDAAREFAYDRESPFGRLSSGLTDAAANHWWIVDMKSDWNTIFPPPAR